MANQPRQPERPQRGVRASLELDVRGVPEVLQAARRELAQLLRDQALDEGPEVAAFAERVAAAFEAGQGE